MKNSEKPAFAYGFANEQRYHEVTGLTKREHFAGLALQGIVSKPNTGLTKDVIALMSVQLADALLLELEKSKA